MSLPGGGYFASETAQSLRALPFALAPLVIVGLMLSPYRVQAGDLGPARLGLPGVSATLSPPAGGGPPLRFGLSYSTGTFDDTHGLSAYFGEPSVRSQEFCVQLQVRASRFSVASVSVPYRIVGVQGGESWSGLGDLEIGLSLRLFQRGRWRVGGWGGVRLPTGVETDALTTNVVEGEYGLTSSLLFFPDSNLPEMQWSMNVGYRINKNEDEGYGWQAGDPRELGVFFPVYPSIPEGGKTRDNDEILLRTAVDFRKRWAHLFFELSSDWLAMYDRATFQESATWFSPGIYAGYEDGPGIKATWSIGLFADDADTEYEPRLPDWRLSISATYPLFLGGRDRDDDGVPDSRDECPTEPEDRDGHADDDGCPDDDNDGDGIPDRRDAAPNLAEDFDDFEDEDGRPDRDNDLDGIVDELDQCPNQPEDFDGVEDFDGCPDIVLDSDRDGLADEADQCPYEAEDHDGFEDSDGCPDPDNDLDGIPDAQDACPDEREDYDGDRDDDGCPDN
jgi:hypothetical protein